MRCSNVQALNPNVTVIQQNPPSPSGTVTNAQNEGGGEIELFDAATSDSTTLKFRTLSNAGNVKFTDNGDGTVEAGIPGGAATISTNDVYGNIQASLDARATSTALAAVQNEVTAEVARAEAAEADLQSELDAETAARIAGDNARPTSATLAASSGSSLIGAASQVISALNGGGATVAAQTGQNVQAIVNDESRIFVDPKPFDGRFDAENPSTLQTYSNALSAQINAIAAIGQGPFNATLSNTTTYAQCSAFVSSPSTRYTWTPSGSAEIIAVTTSATASFGLRTNIPVQALQTFTTNCTWSATGTFNASSAVQVGLDSGTSVGTYQYWTTGNVFFSWHSDGTVIAYTNSTVAYNDSGAAGYTATLASGSATTFTNTDTTEISLTVNSSLTGGTLTLKKNGTQVATYTVTGTITGFICSAMRMNVQTATLNSFVYNLPFTIPSLPAQPTTAATVIASVDNRVRQIRSSQPGNTNAYLPRAVPTGFSNIPILPVIVRGVGSVSLTGSLRSAFMGLYGSTINAGSVAWVNQTTGSDSTGAAGNINLPFATIQAAMNSAARVVLVAPGSYSPFSLRTDQTSGAGPKMVLSQIRGAATITPQGGDILGNLVWTQNVTYPNLWSATITSSSVTSVDKITHADVLDSRGFPARMPNYADTTLAALGAAGYGWTYNPTGRLLTVALNGANLNTAAAYLKAYYLDTANNSRIFCYGSKLYISGFRLENVLSYALNFTGPVRSEIWSEDNVRFMSPGTYGLAYGTQNVGSWTFTCGDRIHATSSDAFNYDSVAGIDSQGLEALCYVTDAGDMMTNWPASASIFPNVNGSSSHTGYVARFGSVYEGSFGPEIADTSSATFTNNATWMVATSTCYSELTGKNTASVGTGIYGINGVGNRSAWLDTAFGDRVNSGALRIEAGSPVKTFNCSFTTTVLGPGGTSPTAYTPDAP